MVYLVLYEGEDYYVEAGSYAEADRYWKSHMASERGAEWDDNAESIGLLSNSPLIHGPVIRQEGRREV